MVQPYFDGLGGPTDDQIRQLGPGGGWSYCGKVKRFAAHKNQRKFSKLLRNYAVQHGIKLSDWLTEYDLVRPNHAAVAKNSARYDHLEYDLDWEVFDIAFQWVHHEFYSICCDSRELPLEEVIKDANKQASMGGPWSHVFADKNAALEDPVVLDYLAKHWDELATDEYSGSLWVNSLKEEIRPKAKLLLNKIRTFTGSAGELSLNGGRLCKDFNDKLTAGAVRSASCKGMPKQYGVWHRFIEKCSRFKEGFELDGNQFDARMLRAFMFAIYSFRWKCLAQEHRTQANFVRLWNICRDIVYSIVVFDNGATFLKYLGNPSGSPNTIDDNTIYDFAVIAYGIIKRLKDLGKPYSTVDAYLNFKRNCDLAIVGDDANIFRSENYRDVIDLPSLRAIWKNIGYIVETPCEVPRVAHEMEFLSHSCIWNEQALMWLPMPNVKKLLASLCYDRLPQYGYSLLRAIAIYGELWPDPFYRKIMFQYITDVIDEFDDIFNADEWWRMAKLSLHSDDFYFWLYTGLESPNFSLALPKN